MRAPLLVIAATLLVACGETATGITGDAGSVDVASDLGASTIDAPDAPSASDAPSAVDAPDAPSAADAPDASLVPFVAPDRTWTWIDVAGTACDDGSPTGIGVNLAAGATGTLVFLNGGGFCFDYATCFTLNTAAHGPFGRDQFAQLSSQFSGSVLDRGLAQSPFADFNLVFVPYCTGDLHAGTGATEYAQGGSTRSFQHVGRLNLRADLQRLASALPAPARLVLAGSGAGGFGAAFSHDLARSVFPGGAVSIVDDSGPLLVGDAIPASQRAAWFDAWHLSWLDERCAGCRTDLSALYASLATRYPDDRTALVSSLQDRVTRTMFGQTAERFEADLRALAVSLDARPGRRAFLIAGQGTAAFLRPAETTAADGAALLPWLAAMVDRSGPWEAHGP